MNANISNVLDSLGTAMWKNRLSFEEWVGYRAFMFRRRKCKALRELHSIGFDLIKCIDKDSDDLNLYMVPCIGPSIMDSSLCRLADVLENNARSCRRMADMIESLMNDKMSREIGSGIAESLRVCGDDMRSMSRNLADNPRWIDVAHAASRMKTVGERFRVNMNCLENILVLYNILNDSSRKCMEKDADLTDGPATT